MNPGDLISGKYRLLRLLGSGGMGSVWAARNELTDRDFAIKFLLQRLSSNSLMLQRFFHEARACGQLKHPAIVDVYDMGQAEDGSPYIVMELLEGEGMDQRLAREGRFAPSEAAAWISFVARGLDEAHVRGLIHRDLKPGNVFFALDDRGDVMPKVLDFGISKATGVRTAEGAPSSGRGSTVPPAPQELLQTMQGTVLGSPSYMSPEQAKGDTDIDARSDVWALGVILYEAITGKVPFDASNYNALMVQIIAKPHRPVIEVEPACPAEISTIIDQVLQKDRDRRIPSARELADRLEHALMSITGTPYLHYQPKASVFSVRPPMGSQPQIGTTGGPWTDGAPTLVRPPRSKLPYIALAAGALAFAAAGAVVLLRPPAPIVGIAGRASNVMSEALARAHDRVGVAKTEALAEEKLKEAERLNAAQAAQAAAQASASAQPSAAPSDKLKKPAKGGPRPKKDDPTGGVGNAGFN